MKQKNQEQERIRKEYAPKGERGQKMMSFRLDMENLDWLNMQTNRGRYLNQLIAEDRNRYQHSIKAAMPGK